MQGADGARVPHYIVTYTSPDVVHLLIRCTYLAKTRHPMNTNRPLILRESHYLVLHLKSQSTPKSLLTRSFSLHDLTQTVSNMTLFHLMTITVVCCGTLALAKTDEEGLRNKHPTIEGEYWRPFLTYDFDENGTAINYQGIMWDLVLFMQKSRNFTFTMVSKTDYVWGECFAINNCTGMLGMVNRREVDLALGKH